jgi:hypothetical protein
VTIASENSASKSNEQASATQQVVTAIEEVAGLAEATCRDCEVTRIAGMIKVL